MRSPSPSYEQLRERLAVVEETLRAIRGGEVDALVVQTEAGERVFTLEGADAFYRVLVEEMPLGVAGLHASGTILYANAGLAQMLRLPLERVVGARIGDFLPEGGAPAAGAGVSVDGLPAELGELVRATGERFPVEVSVAAVPGDETASVCLIVADVSERALAAAERARLAAIVEASDDAIVGLTPAGVIESWNDGAVKLYGYSADEAIGRHAASLFASDAAEREQRLAGVAGGAGPAAVEGRDVRKDGSEVDVSVTDSPIRDADGRVIGIARIARDISTQKRAERALRAAEASAAAARDEALEATRAKSEFLANVSHELRTPLNGVIGMTGLLLDTELGAEQRDYAELAQASGRALLQLVGDVLDLAKIEAGRLTLERSEFNLLDTVEQVCELEAQPARQKGVELAVAIDAAVPGLVRGDELRLRQVLRNLVSNAVKFTAAGEVVVSVTRAGDAGLRFEVRDSGIGIEPERLGRLFEPFTQADSATARRYGGTGLGLAIVEQLVELMGGQIDAHSEPDKGSSFEFTLPLEPAEQQPDDARRRLAGMRLLVADANPTSRRALAAQATRWGATPLTAARLDEALALLRQAAARGEHFHAVMLDARLPGLDAAALAQLSADAALGSPRLILLGAALAERRLAREAGIDEFLLKPARRRRLEAALTGERGSMSAAPQRERPPPAAARPLAGARVLVAEDDEVNQLLAVRMLEKRGIDADVAADGREALAALERRDYDAVLMDCQMPELDGYEATRRLRRREPPGRRLPIIALTGHALKDDAARCLAAGMDDYLAKPLDPATFDAVLSRWIRPDARQRHAQQRTPRPPPDGAPAPLLDPAALDSLLAELGDPGTIRQLVDSFVRDSDRRVEQLSQAIDAGDLDAANQLAHRIKGGAQPLGAALLADLCQQLETTTEPDTARALGAQLSDAYPASRAALLAASPNSSPSAAAP